MRSQVDSTRKKGSSLLRMRSRIFGHSRRESASRGTIHRGHSSGEFGRHAGRKHASGRSAIRGEVGRILWHPRGHRARSKLGLSRHHCARSRSSKSFNGSSESRGQETGS